MFKGSIVALVTPFRNGAIDEAAIQQLVEWHIAEGTHGIVPVGTTGESPTLSHAEHHRVVDLCIEAAAKRVPVIAGAGSNATDEAVSLARHAKAAGADAALVVTPYYNKPTQDGMFAHFTAIADAVDLPILIYNIPGRSVVDMSVETMARLARHPNIVGVKDATADLARPLATGTAIGWDFCQLSGEDATALAFYAGGGHGCISVTANVAPRLCAEMYNAWDGGDIKAAVAINKRLYPLSKALFIESNPAPAKYALSTMGRIAEELRLPLVPVRDTTRAAVRDAMAFAGLSNA
ncbi:MAG: 4-hydroxy-tetrahydrodipicolinate synthase [Alphaproteobacteria bacterium]